MRPGYVRALIAATGFLLIAAACGSDDGVSIPRGTGLDTSTTATTPAPTTSDAPASETTDAPQGAPSGGEVEGDLTVTVADGYRARWIGEGIKPDLALSPEGNPGIAYLQEDLNGFIAYAEAASGWEPERVVNGYFYGPIGLTYSPDGVPHIAFHDHQDTTFKQDKGDLSIAIAESTEWAVEAINHDGHDGWDSTVVIGTDGVLRAAGIDPVQFGRTQGVEYYEFDGDTWQVTEIGSGPVAYEFNVSLAVDPDGNPALTYYDTANGDLRFAALREGAWTIETVDSDGDAGRYSSLAFDASGDPHISYLRLDGPSSGTVRYATVEGGAWATADVDSLSDIRTGFTGARRITAIAIDDGQAPHIVYSDESVIRHAVPNPDGWDAETIATAGERVLGQLVSLGFSRDGTMHLAAFEVTSTNPLAGAIAYITTG